MKLLLSSLLLASLCALSSWSVSSGTLVLTQTPDVSVTEGETVNITCCWTGEFERATVNWMKNQTRIKILILKSRSQREERSNCLDLTFKNITREDSGRYTCRMTVDIPTFTLFEGSGTIITVMARDNTTDNTTHNPLIADDSNWEEALIYFLRCLPIFALVTTFFCLNKLWTKTQQCTPAAPGENQL